MKELKNIDQDFNEALFITKVNNIFVKLHTAIMLNNLESVRHFLGDKVYKKYLGILEDLNKNNEQQIYDELNIKETYIEDIQILEDKINIKVKIISRYMDYIIDKDTLDFIRGNNINRIQKDNYLTFTKKLVTKELNTSRHCISCGASIDLNNSGKCMYCGNIFPLENYDYILTNIVIED